MPATHISAMNINEVYADAFVNRNLEYYRALKAKLSAPPVVTNSPVVTNPPVVKGPVVVVKGPKSDAPIGDGLTLAEVYPKVIETTREVIDGRTVLTTRVNMDGLFPNNDAQLDGFLSTILNGVVSVAGQVGQAAVSIYATQAAVDKAKADAAAAAAGSVGTQAQAGATAAGQTLQVYMPYILGIGALFALGMIAKK